MGFLAGSAKHKYKFCPKCGQRSWQGTGLPYFRCAHYRYEDIAMPKQPKKPWKAMSSAPKDGTWILLVEDGKMSGLDGHRYVASYWDPTMNQKKGGWVDGPGHQAVPLGWMEIIPYKR